MSHKDMQQSNTDVLSVEMTLQLVEESGMRKNRKISTIFYSQLEHSVDSQQCTVPLEVTHKKETRITKIQALKAWVRSPHKATEYP